MHIISILKVNGGPLMAWIGSSSSNEEFTELAFFDLKR